MKCKLLVILAVTGRFLLTVGPMFAHHAGTTYDRTHTVTLSGTVTEYDFTNPHTLIHFDVKEENGDVSHWIAQTSSPRKLFRVGWDRSTLKPGDSITITGFASKDGKKTLAVRELKPPRGGVLKDTDD